MIDIDAAARELEILWSLPGRDCRLRLLGQSDTGLTAIIHTPAQRFFLKWMRDGDPLEAEQDGLIRLAPVVRVPGWRYLGPLAGGQALILEWLELGQSLSAGQWWQLGQLLRRLHSVSSDQFGYHSRQYNTPSPDWATFFVNQRLAPQWRRACQRGLPAAEAGQVEAVMAMAMDWLAEVTVTPSLVHGDLWSGNLGTLTDGTLVLFDPAVYYGHGEVDLAMLELFGVVPEECHRGYGIDPHDPAVVQRKTLYNLYHLLNHFVLFGSGYLNAITRSCRTLLSY
ncbi:hypothetical protein A6D6_04175 [Alcanivorax xiamenensis]|uniref:Fructosamine-3-kinase n=1 Tax=Alcanivorax xiamenensis TaxID=1177156 RepID=A0ABQ6Y294_9GAMM|nr:fructosamine kinase family protein [Alcanivorax xiamenensis]KAF0802032.1 hypothetical protein A6D6_04175 [Alcanivorax xiamenensis]